MTPAAPPLELAQLDAERSATLADRTWTANLQALAVEQRELAEELRQAALPAHWRPVHALDGFITYRLEPPGAPPQWLGGCAAPLLRARAVLENVDPAGRNPGLASIGTGAELVTLLERLPKQLALYVFETELVRLAAVLRTQDFADAIQSGRCVLLPPGREAAQLQRLMKAQPGLMPPGNITLPDLVSPARVAELKTICEHVNAATAEERSRRIAQLRAQTRSARRAAKPRLALFSLLPQPVAQAALEQVAQAGAGLGWPVLRAALSGPRTVDPLVHCAAAAEFGATLALFVNHLPALLPISPAGAVGVWFHSDAAVPAELPQGDVLYLAASPRVSAALERAGVPAAERADWFWACDDSALPPAVDPEGPVLLVADLPDLRPEPYGVTQETHRRLWAHLREQAAKLWATPRIARADQLLVNAERTTGARLTETELRERLVRLIERVVIPGVVADHVARALATEGYPVAVLGRGWGALELPGVRVASADLQELASEENAVRPRACVSLSGRDPLNPALLHAAAAGWPLLLHELGGQPVMPALGGVLRAGQHFEPFADLAGLLRTLQLLREAPPNLRRRAERAREHVRQHHSYRCRLEELTKRLRGDG